MYPSVFTVITESRMARHEDTALPHAAAAVPSRPGPVRSRAGRWLVDVGTRLAGGPDRIAPQPLAGAVR